MDIIKKKEINNIIKMDKKLKIFINKKKMNLKMKKIIQTNQKKLKKILKINLKFLLKLKKSTSSHLKKHQKNNKAVKKRVVEMV